MICLQYTWGFKDYFACDDMKQIYKILCRWSVNNVDILSIDKDYKSGETKHKITTYVKYQITRYSGHFILSACIPNKCVKTKNTTA